MRILVTGNQGYVGPVLGAHLRRVMPDCTLAGLDVGLFAGCLLEPREWPDRCYDLQRYRDVRDITEADLQDLDAIVHLAAVSNDPMGNAFERPTEDINLNASLRLARLAKQAGVRRFVFASSCSVYGAGSEAPRTESDPVAPLTAYARSKIALEEGLRPLADGSFQVTCLRFATACGLSPRLRLDLVLNDFVAAAVASGTIQVLSDGNPWRPLIHVRDMARAIEWGLRRGSGEGGEFVVVNAGADDWNFTIRDLANAVAQALGRVDVRLNSAAAPDKRSYRVDFGLFCRLAPHHVPAMTLAGAVAELAAGMRSAGFRQTDFREGDCIRLKVLGRLMERGVLNADLRWTEYAQ
jgi:nucleoside-diphosphate-sugar epimerase